MVRVWYARFWGYVERPMQTGRIFYAAIFRNCHDPSLFSVRYMLCQVRIVLRWPMLIRTDSGRLLYIRMP
jgi:hypothetical protein